MKIKLSGITLLFIAFISLTHTSFANPKKAAAELAQTAVSNDATESKLAISELREMGAGGLEAMFSAHAEAIKAFTANGDKTQNWLKLAAAIDSVSMQKDSYASQLYWFTDLERAKAEAKRTGKPILSLRLLGNLNEELSCANSRFFRTALYSNSEISSYLKTHYVLHWQSVRPAPRVTIDFGDGRKMETTLTGNSIHYILNSDGYVLDAIPGLYGPKVFLSLLQQAESFSRSLANAKTLPSQTPYYGNQLRRIDRAWNADLTKANVTLKRNENPAPVTPVALPAVPATIAANGAVSKMISESTLMPVFIMRDRFSELEKQTDLEQWKTLSKFRLDQVTLDAASRGVIQRKLSIKSAELDKLVKQFEENVALDTVRNEYLFHSKILRWLSEGSGNDLDKFNERVYAELFMTPHADPWLGLFTPETFNGIENSGISK